MGFLQDFYNQNSSTINFFGLNAILGLSIYLTLAAGLLSLANAGFMAIGAYVAALLTIHAQWPFWAVVPAGGLVAALVAVPLGLPVLRLRGVFLAIATVGFGEIVRLFFVNWDFTNGAMGLVAIPQRTRLWTIAIAVALALFVLGRLRGSRTGYALEAIREDETAARTMGIQTTGHKLAMFMLGGALAGLAGGLEAHFTFIVSPGGYGFGRVVEMLVQAVVGGTAAFYGPVVGATFLTVLPEVLREAGTRLGIAPGPFRLLLNGIILLAVILYLPNGLVSLPATIRRRGRRTA